MERYLDTSLSPTERAEALLNVMSVEEKLAQLQGLMPLTMNPADCEDKFRHGLGQISTLNVRMFETLEEAAVWQKAFQQAVMEKSEHHIPAVFHMEGVCGAFLKGALSLPAPIGRGASFDPKTEEEAGRIVGRQELSVGFTQTLAPVLDVAHDPRMGRQGESYGEDPVLVARMGTAFERGVENQEVDGRHDRSCAKHFLGFHTSSGGIHGANSELSLQQLREIYGLPFEAAIRENGLSGVMECYNAINGIPVSASKEIMTDLLRAGLGFDGAVISDYSAIENSYIAGVGETLTETGYLCLQAGIDVELPNVAAYNAEMLENFRSGRWDTAVLDRAVLHVLKEKFRMGLFEHPFALQDDALREAVRPHDPEDIEVSHRLAQESMVLLKNNGILPLEAEKLKGLGIRRIAVIGPHAGNARYFFGGYTHVSFIEAVYAFANSLAGVGEGGKSASSGKQVRTWPGSQVEVDDRDEFCAILDGCCPGCQNLYEALKEDFGREGIEVTYSMGYPIAGTDRSGFVPAFKEASKADLVILTLGGKYGSGSISTQGEGVDRTDINVPKVQEEFVEEVYGLGKPLIAIHFGGSPVSSGVVDEKVDALLEAWAPAETGAWAITQVLTGQYNPAGRMPVTTARKVGQVPIYYNHPNGTQWHQSGSIGFPDYVDCPHTPRYYFGQGLSYTEFEYSNLHLSNETIGPEEETIISFDVQNVGPRDGDEVVQMYFRDPHASMLRPVKELAGFRRIHLAAGEKERVTFHFHASQTAFILPDSRWMTEKGTIEIQVGASSEDIRLEGEIYITDTRISNGRDRVLYSN